MNIDSDGILPDIRDDLDNFKNVVVWKTIKNVKIPEPAPNVDQEYDSAENKVKKI